MTRSNNNILFTKYVTNIKFYSISNESLRKTKAKVKTQGLFLPLQTSCCMKMSDSGSAYSYAHVYKKKYMNMSQVIGLWWIMVTMRHN